MGDRIKHLLIGIFVAAGLFILVFTILFLKPSVGDGKETLYVRFSNINKIGIGTYVTYAGRPIGEVTAVHEIPHPREQPTDSLGRYYIYQLTLTIDSGIKVYTTDKIELQTSGLLGEKSVAIIPRAPPAGVTPKLITSQPVYANSIDTIENTFYEIGKLSSEVEKTVKEMRSWITENKTRLNFAVEWFGQTMYQANTLIKDVNENEIVHHVSCASKSLAHLMQQLDLAIYQLHQANTFNNLGSTVANFTDASDSIRTITERIACGEGSLGKIFKKDDFYISLMSVMQKINNMMNDINNYGLLFNNNKQWQRIHAQRAQCVYQIEAPEPCNPP